MNADSDDASGKTGSPAAPPGCAAQTDHARGGLVVSGRVGDVARWRRSERERLIAARLALSAEERMAHAGRLATELDAVMAHLAPGSVSLYWPFRGEPDLRPWMQSAHAKGLQISLPVVVAKARPLEFRRWWPGATLARGVWNIPYPAEGRTMIPEVVIAPLVGFDAAGFRLGYGGGFFDRTLATTTPRPIAIGVGHPVGLIPTIYPQPHDIAMDWLLSGDGKPCEFPSRSNAR